MKAFADCKISALLQPSQDLTIRQKVFFAHDYGTREILHKLHTHELTRVLGKKHNIYTTIADTILVKRYGLTNFYIEEFDLKRSKFREIKNIKDLDEIYVQRFYLIFNAIFPTTNELRCQYALNTQGLPQLELLTFAQACSTSCNWFEVAAFGNKIIIQLNWSI